jgi:hypothetical protein
MNEEVEQQQPEPYEEGEMVRLLQTRGYVKKSEAGRLMTVRGVSSRGPGGPHVRVDDGDPKDPNLETNGFTISMWVPMGAVERVRSTGKNATPRGA